jgi:hypothetical protein
MEALGSEKGGKTSTRKYTCSKCNYVCSKKYNFDRHLMTPKHLKEINFPQMEIKNEQNEQNEQKNIFICENCNKTYVNSSGLWKHKKNCKSNNHEVDEINDKQLIMMLIKENSEFKNMMMKVLENGTYNNSHNTNYSHNKTFNLQFFLNETCKNAMNIKDFVENVELELSDLENVGKSGYIEGISNIIIKNLKALGVENRPIHCTDKKRETFYIKDKDVWEKEEDNKPKIRELIKAISHKNICMFKQFRDKYPDCEQGDSKKSDIFDKIVYESMGGKGDDDMPKQDKIIQKITKHITIDKDNLV